MVNRVPGEAPKPIRPKRSTGAFGFAGCHFGPGLARILGQANRIITDNHYAIFISTEERSLPEIHRRALRLPTRAFVLADEQAIGCAQVTDSFEHHRPTGLGIGIGNL